MRILDCGVAVVEGDTHVSKWVSDQKRLDISRPYLLQFKQYLTSKTVVIDAGAMIGDHTIVYSDWCRQVHAFEPSKKSFECLQHNMRDLKNVTCYSVGLSDSKHKATVSENENQGAACLEKSADGTTACETLDSFSFDDIGFIKIDVEGFEYRVLFGAIETIETTNPAMLIEVNDGALRRAGSSREELIDIVEYLGYSHSITDRRIKYSDPQYDILCLKK
jgi:FkbM family methyltransferase